MAKSITMHKLNRFFTNTKGYKKVSEIHVSRSIIKGSLSNKIMYTTQQIKFI